MADLNPRMSRRGLLRLTSLFAMSGASAAVIAACGAPAASPTAAPKTGEPAKPAEEAAAPAASSEAVEGGPASSFMPAPVGPPRTYEAMSKTAMSFTPGVLIMTPTQQKSENLPAGSHVIFMKHSSTWETYAIMTLFPPLVWVMKREILWIPFVGWGCMLARCIAIDRKAGHSAVNQVLVQGKDRMERFGAWVLVFPEGTRMAPGETRKYGSSGTLLAAQQNCKIVPVAHNAGLYWPRNAFLKRPGTVTIRIGPSIDSTSRDPLTINAMAKEWIEEQQKALG